MATTARDDDRRIDNDQQRRECPECGRGFNGVPVCAWCGADARGGRQ